MYLFTVNVDTPKEVLHEVSDIDTLLGFVEAALTGPLCVPDGGAILIRRADYLDTPDPEEVGSVQPRLRLIKGGKT